MPAWAEQRRFPRYVVHLSLLYEVTGLAESRVGVGWTLELSEGGACVEIGECLSPLTPIRLCLQTGGQSIEAGARVVWAGKPDLPGGVCHGVAFTQIATNHLQTLRDLLESPRPDRRRGIRHPIDLEVTCQRIGGADSPLHGRTGDVSRDGFLLLLPEVVALGTDLAVTLRAPSGPLTVEGKIVWVEPPEIWTPGQPIAHGFEMTSRSRCTQSSVSLVIESS